MKAMILAAGQGTRLRPLTERIPKCMIPIGGMPILEHTIVWLAHYGIRDIIINLSYMPQAVMDHFGDGSRWDVKLTYSIEQEALGTAGGLKKVASFFEGNQPFLLWYGDNLSRCDLGRLIARHTATGSVATIALHHREEVSQSGIVGLDSNDRIVRFLEKPRPEQVFSHWVNAGIYVLAQAVLDSIPADAPTDFARDVFPAILAAGQPLYGYRLAEGERFWWIDRPEDLERVRNEWEAAS
jgi:NDP-sugar pyrophosphorylase family protein